MNTEQPQTIEQLEERIASQKERLRELGRKSKAPEITSPDDLPLDFGTLYLPNGESIEPVSRLIYKAQIEVARECAEIASECRVIVCETEPLKVAREVAEDIARQIRERFGI